MWNCLRNLKTYAIELEGQPSAVERTSIRRWLLARQGVLDARFDHTNPYRLVIEYNADILGSLGLLEALRRRGVAARPVSSVVAQGSAAAGPSAPIEAR